METALTLYMPALHQGYLNLIERCRNEIDALFLIDKALAVRLVPALAKDIRAVNPDDMACALEGLGMPCPVAVLHDDTAAQQLAGYGRLILPDEDVSRALVATLKQKKAVTYDSAFLRWDSANVQTVQADAYDCAVTAEAFYREVMTSCADEARATSDWWRSIGAAVVRDGTILGVAHNRHMPDSHLPNVLGDVRCFLEPGTRLDLYTSIHAEIGAMAAATRDHGSVAGADLFATTFPCAACAGAAAAFGIRRIFFVSGHSSLNSFDVLKSADIEIIRVDMSDHR